MPPAPFMPSAVVWRRSGFEAKWSGKLSGKMQYRPNMSSKWCPHGLLEASWEPPGGFLGGSWRAPGGQAARLEGQCQLFERFGPHLGGHLEFENRPN